MDTLITITMCMVFVAVSILVSAFIIMEFSLRKQNTDTIREKRNLNYEESTKLEKLKETLKNCENEEEPDEKSISKLKSAIDSLEYYNGISDEDVEMSDNILRAIDSLIDLYTHEYTCKNVLVQEKIEVIHVDKIVEYVSKSVYDSLNQKIFETPTMYSKEFLINYITKKSKVYVLTFVIAYNTSLV